jgi:hypothetical protein
MNKDNNIDLEWVKAQLTAARIRRGSGDAVLQLLELWETMDIDSELSKEAIETFSQLALGYSLIPEDKDEVWVPAMAGQISVGQQVRVKSNAFQGGHGIKLNGRRGNIVAIRTGRIVVKSTDGIAPELDGEHFRAEQLDVRVK